MTRNRVARVLGVLLSGATCLAGSSVSAQVCPGDCNGDGTVSLQEAVLVMRISLERGGAEVTDCLAADVDFDDVVGVGETVRVMTAFHSGCAAGGTSATAATSGALGTPSVEISNESGLPGETVPISATLDDAGSSIAGIEQEIHVDPLTPFVSCSVNPAIDKNASAFALRPNGCTPGVDCTSIKALILSFTNVDPIADGSLLFTCDVRISPSAPSATYPLDSQLEGASDPVGNAIALDGIDGSISVGVAPTPTSTPVPPTLTPTPVPVLASLILERVRLRADTAVRPGRDNGKISVRGVVNANDPFANFVEDIIASGLTARVTGAGSVDELLTWGSADCSVRPTRNGPRIRCAADDADSKRRVDLRPMRIPNLFRAKLFAKRLSFPPPLTAGSVAVVITTTSFQRSDTIEACKLSRGGNSVTCRESGFVPTATPTWTPTPTSTFTPTTIPTDTPTPPDGTTLVVGDAIGAAGATVSFTVGLETNGSIAGIENELHLDPGAPLSFVDCFVNPDIDKNLFLNISTPSDLKALLLSFASLDPIPHGSILYTCEVGIDGAAPPAGHTIDCTAPGASDPVGNAIPTECRDGTITVVP